MEFVKVLPRLRVAWVVVTLSPIVAVGVLAAPTPLSVVDPGWQDSVRFLVTRGALKGLYATTHPYTRNEVERSLDGAARDASRPFDRALAGRLRGDMWASGDDGLHVDGLGEARWGPELDPRALPALRTALQYRSGSAVTLYQEFEISPGASQPPRLAGALSTPEQRVRGWNPGDIFDEDEDGYVADFTRAFLSARVGPLTVSLGRHALAWGPGVTGSLLLSDASPGLDGVSLSGTFGRVRGTAVFATLNQGWHTEDRRYLARRYFAAHRVHWKPSQSLELGMMDAVLYGGDIQPIKAYYLNPVVPFYASQFNTSSERDPVHGDDNVMIGFDARWMPRPGWSLYGEVLVDDFRYDPDSPDPHALGWVGGIHRAGLWVRGEWRVEYARIGRYTYTHLLQEQQYTHFGRSLGYSTGNDADVIHASAAWWPSHDSRLSLRLEQRRKGESGVADRFRGETDKSFLHGAAEVRRSVAVDGWWRVGSGWLVGSGVSAIRVRSRDHMLGDNRTLIEWRGTISRRLGGSL